MLIEDIFDTEDSDETRVEVLAGKRDMLYDIKRDIISKLAVHIKDAKASGDYVLSLPTNFSEFDQVLNSGFINKSSEHHAPIMRYARKTERINNRIHRIYIAIQNEEERMMRDQ